MVFIRNSKGEWWELDKEKRVVSNFDGGFHEITQQELESSEILECNGWYDLYKIKDWCPLEVSIRYHDVWISPDGVFYNGDAHDNRAEEILEVVYGEDGVAWPGDTLEELGWVRATRSLMWEVRTDSGYWNEKVITQKQYDVLWDWCKHHNKTFPQNLEVK